MANINHNSQSGKWHFWIDRGGTFTDIIARSPTGSIRLSKLLSDNPRQYADAAVYGIHQLLGSDPTGTLPGERIQAVKMGTTLATNALLQRKGTRVALCITRGFGDLLEIGNQQRPEIFSLTARRVRPLYSRIIEVEERIAADGTVLIPLNEEELLLQLQQLRSEGYDSLAIALMHGYTSNRHERQIESLARNCGFCQVSTSHRCAALVKLVSRGQTAVADAYLSPVLHTYVEALEKNFNSRPRAGQLSFMRSDGGLCDRSEFAGRSAVLSGPAGGVVGTAEVARMAGYTHCIGFDMGGTSTDVSLFQGRFERTFDNEINGIHLSVPMMRVHTVAAGGSSVISALDGRLRVGPDSAGAEPGPACYGKGGPLCISDAQATLGVLSARYFPQVFGPTHDAPLNIEKAREKCLELAQQLGQDSAEWLAQSAVDVAVANMVRAIRRITVEQGLNPKDYPLCGFGGAAGQHICAVAESLGSPEILLHPFASLLSAWGIALAPLRENDDFVVEALLGAQLLQSLQARSQSLYRQQLNSLEKLHGKLTAVERECILHLKFPDTDTALAVPFNSDPERCKADFEARFRQRFGYFDHSQAIVVALISTATTASQNPVPQWSETVESEEPVAADEETEIYLENQWCKIPVLHRKMLSRATAITGPALILEQAGTILLRPGWRARLEANGLLRLSLARKKSSCKALAAKQPQPTEQADPALTEIFYHRLMGIAEQMGLLLENSALSVNIRERLDFSCAIFDGEGRLIANAPHIPVHLGSMGETVRAIIDRHHNTMAPDSAYASNDPLEGGTHLPDITVVSPVFCGSEKSPLLFVAARGHHADIGGSAPASMPAHSRTPAEEGVLLRSIQILADGIFNEAELQKILSSGELPARNPELNLFDLQAQLAACRQGVTLLQEMFEEQGAETILHYMASLRQSARTAVQRTLSELNNGSHTTEMDNGAIIAVDIRIERQKRTAVLDFSRSSSIRNDNFNAPRAICKAAVLYVFRCLLEQEIPLNDGCLEPLKLILPTGSILNPDRPVAVVAGNVETSQVIVDTLLAALNRQALSQGTMNNLSFGDGSCQYYETICGGSGAGPGFDGASAAQVHMTNSRMTDPEILERRFPVRVEQFSIRRNSGGRGRWGGGDGVIRILRFLRPMTVSLLGNRRKTCAAGLQGGEDGKPGINLLIGNDNTAQMLEACAEFTVENGEQLSIETPGGGGWGTAEF